MGWNPSAWKKCQYGECNRGQQSYVCRKERGYGATVPCLCHHQLQQATARLRASTRRWCFAEWMETWVTSHLWMLHGPKAEAGSRWWLDKHLENVRASAGYWLNKPNQVEEAPDPLLGLGSLQVSAVSRSSLQSFAPLPHRGWALCSWAALAGPEHSNSNQDHAYLRKSCLCSGPAAASVFLLLPRRWMQEDSWEACLCRGSHKTWGGRTLE